MDNGFITNYGNVAICFGPSTRTVASLLVVNGPSHLTASFLLAYRDVPLLLTYLGQKYRHFVHVNSEVAYLPGGT